MDQGGDPKWLLGLEYIPPKLRAIYDINKILAHKPWLLNKEHIERLTSWSLGEIVHAIVILTHFHSLSSFVFSCGLTQELDKTSSHKSSLHSSKIATPLLIEDTDETYKKQQEVTVEALMATMKVLSETPNECTEAELSNRFKNVEKQAAELPAVIKHSIVEVPSKISHYIHDPTFTYQDFAKRGHDTSISTFRIQDYSWDDHGYSLVNR